MLPRSLVRRTWQYMINNLCGTRMIRETNNSDRESDAQVLYVIDTFFPFPRNLSTEEDYSGEREIMPYSSSNLYICAHNS